MRRFRRLDVSVDMAVHLLLLWLLFHGAVPLVFESGDHCTLSWPVAYLFWAAESVLYSGLVGGLGLFVLAVAWLETRVELRPWVKRCLRLAGPLFLASLLWAFYLLNQ